MFRISFSVTQHLNSGVGGLTVEVSRSLSHTHTHTHTHGRNHPNDSSSFLYDLVIDGWSKTEKRTYRRPFPLYKEISLLISDQIKIYLWTHRKNNIHKNTVIHLSKQRSTLWLI